MFFPIKISLKRKYFTTNKLQIYFHGTYLTKLIMFRSSLIWTMVTSADLDILYSELSWGSYFRHSTTSSIPFRFSSSSKIKSSIQQDMGRKCLPFLKPSESKISLECLTSPRNILVLCSWYNILPRHLVRPGSTTWKTSMNSVISFIFLCMKHRSLLSVEKQNLSALPQPCRG